MDDVIHERRHLLRDHDLSALGPHWRFEAEHGCKPRIAEPRGEHDPLRRELAARAVQPKLAWARLDAIDRVIGAVPAAELRKAEMEGVQKAQRVHMAIGGAEASAG